MRAMIRSLRLFLLAVVTLALVGACNVQSPALSPADNDPLYHCRIDGHVAADETWCFPVDGSHTCCPPSSECIPPDADGMSHGCAATEDPHTFGARRTMARMAESR